MSDEDNQGDNTVSEAALALPEPEPERSELDKQRISVVESAAAEALDSSAMARDEFLTLAMTAKMLSMSGAAPKEVRNNPHVAFHIAMIGRDLGISPTMAMNFIDIIPGQNGPQISLSPQLRAAQVKRLGIGMMKPVVQRPDRAVWVALHPHGDVDHRCATRLPDHVEGCDCHGIIGVSEFTWENGIGIGMIDSRCLPAQHLTGCKCKHNWKTYGFRMCSWRAAGYCADDFFPEATVGLYSPDELGALVDDNGKAIDVASVELPDGYSKALPQGQRLAASSELWGLQLRIRSLDDVERADLLDKWRKSEKLGSARPSALTEAQLRFAQALVLSIENEAKRKGVDVEQRIERLQRFVFEHVLSLLGLSAPAEKPNPEPELQPDVEADATAEKPSETVSEQSEAPNAVEQTLQGAFGEVEHVDVSSLTDEEVCERAGADTVEATIAAVKTMRISAVREQLVDRKLDGVGTADALRQRLAFALLRETTDQLGAGQ